MDWVVKHGDIVDEPADILICSANVFLNLSGGVGGEILLRFGDEMQKELHRHLADRDARFLQTGEVIRTGPHGTHFNSVLHAVAVDGFYQSSPAIITDIVAKSLRIAASLNAKTVALTALATGYGKLTMKQFAAGIAPLKLADFLPIEKTAICVRHQSQTDEIATALRI